MKTILLTRRVPSEIVSRLREHFVVKTNDEDVLFAGPTLVERATGCFGILTNLTEKLDQSVLSQLPELKIVANMAVGTNNIDLAAAKQHHIVVTNTPDVLTESTVRLLVRCICSISSMKRPIWRLLCVSASLVVLRKQKPF